MHMTDEQIRERLVDTSEAAMLLGVSRDTLRRYATRGEVPSIRIGRARNAQRLYERHIIELIRRGGREALDEFLAAEKEGRDAA